MTITSPQELKLNHIAQQLYLTYVYHDDANDHHTWDYLDEDVKDNWRMIATTALEQIRRLDPFQTDAVVEGYKLRGLFAVPKGWTYDDAMRDYFEHGWTQAFDSFYDVPDEASNGFS